MRHFATALVFAALAPVARTQQSALAFTVPVSAVSSTLAAKGVALSSDHIRLTTTVPSTVPDPTLRLLALELQPGGFLAARLACQNPAECRPFFAMLLPPDHAQTLSILQSFRNSASAAQPSASTHTGVTVGSLVTLRLADRQMRIQLQGVAIDSAPPGHEIRVASLDRLHTYRGVVVDPSTVEGDLP